MYKCVPFIEAAQNVKKKKKDLKESRSQAFFLLFWEGYSLAAIHLDIYFVCCHHSNHF